jgi:signal transduction histidine kinase
MNGMRLFESFLYGITSPLILVDENGHSVAATATGKAVLEQLHPSVASCVDGGEVLLPLLIRNALQGAPLTQLAAEGGLLRIHRLAEPVDGAVGVLEWVSGSGEEKLRIVQEVSQAVNSSLILEDIFEALGEVLRAYIPYREAVIVILDDSQNGIKILVRISEDGTLEISGEHNTFAGYEPIVDQILRQPVSRLFTRCDLPESFLLAESAAAALVVPLINKGVVIGLIALSTLQEQGFDRHQEILLKEVSAQLAVAVENAKFYWQTQAQASREFLINQLTMSIRQSLDIDVILGTAVAELGKVTGVSRCFIRYFSPSGEEKAFQYLLPGTAPFTDHQASLEKNIFQLRKDQPYNPFILNDVRDCPPVFAPQTLFEENQLRSLAVIPILIRDKLAGTITLHQCDAFRVWVPEDIELLKAMAEHLGVALHQAQLFLELDQQKQALEKTLEELQQAQLYLIQSEKMAVLGQFVAGIAHEVNTPLGTVISNNTTIKKCLDKLKQVFPAEAEPSGAGISPAQLFETAENLLALNKLATTRIQDIVKNLRNFARLDESELKTVDLHEGIDSTILLIQSSMGNGIQLVRDYDENLPLIQCFPGLLNQVFMNLLVNAIHAIRDPENLAHRNGRIEPDQITIQTRYHAESNRVLVSVRDTGKGIPPENMAKVFDPGFTTKGVGVGTGLGLALCYRIVEKHHGRITVESSVNQGTTFTVEIPVLANNPPE